MKISKNTKIFLCVFSIILLVVTVLAIWYTNKHKGSDESQIIIEGAQKTQIPTVETLDNSSDDVRGISLEDTYSTNGLTYTYKNDEENDVPIKFPVIDGLKSDNVQESINSQILEKIKKVLDSNNFKNNSDDSAYVDATVVGNFSDVLSVRVFVKFSNTFSKNYGVNFRLDNGEKIKIDELFTYNAPKKNIITMCAYKSFALSYYTDEGLSNDFYNNIESDILGFLIDYSNGKVAEFSFNPMYIEMYREGKTVRIEMKEYADYIAIYNRFVASSNLYEDSDKIVSALPVFTKRMSCLIDMYEKVDDVCILDVYIVKSEDENDDFSEKEMSAINNYKKDFISRLEYVKRESPIYYSNYITVSRGKENGENILVFSEKEDYIRVSGNDFIQRVYSKILDFERDINNEDYVGSKINMLDDDSIESYTFEVKYSVETGYELREEDEEEVDDDGTDEQNAPEPSPSNEPVEEEPSPEPSETPSSSPVPTSTPTPSEEPVNITTRVYF